MSITITPVLGGLGRVAFGSDGRPMHVGLMGIATLQFTVPGVIRTETPTAYIGGIVGPVALTFVVPGVERPYIGGAVGPVAMTFAVPGVTRS